MEAITFMSSVITFYIKGEISAEQNFVRIKTRNKLGLIPLNSVEERIPITQISLVGMNYKIRSFWFAVGFLLAFVNFIAFTELHSFKCILAIIIGIAMMVCSLRKCLLIDLTSGRVISIPFVIFEWSKVDAAAALINALISNRIDDTNVRIHTDRSIDDNREQTDRVVDAIKGLENKLK